MTYSIAFALCGLFLCQTAANADPFRERLEILVEDTGTCYKHEAQSKKLDKVDIDTAVYAVMARCVEPRERYKAFVARNFYGNPIQFEAYWSERDAKAMMYIKQMLALIRTQ